MPLLVLWDAESGALRAVVEAFALGQLRTAATSAVATDVLAPAGASVLAIIGSGKQSLAQIAAVLSRRPIEEVRIFSPTAAHRASLATRLAGQAPWVRIVDCATPAAAVDGADVVTTATRATAARARCRGPRRDRSRQRGRGDHRRAEELAPSVVAAAAVIVSDAPAAARRAVIRARRGRRDRAACRPRRGRPRPARRVDPVQGDGARTRRSRRRYGRPATRGRPWRWPPSLRTRQIGPDTVRRGPDRRTTMTAHTFTDVSGTAAIGEPDYWEPVIFRARRDRRRGGAIGEHPGPDQRSPLVGLHPSSLPRRIAVTGTRHPRLARRAAARRDDGTDPPHVDAGRLLHRRRRTRRHRGHHPRHRPVRRVEPPVVAAVQLHQCRHRPVRPAHLLQRAAARTDERPPRGGPRRAAADQRVSRRGRRAARRARTQPVRHVRTRRRGDAHALRDPHQPAVTALAGAALAVARGQGAPRSPRSARHRPTSVGACTCCTTRSPAEPTARRRRSSPRSPSVRRASSTGRTGMSPRRSTTSFEAAVGAGSVVAGTNGGPAISCSPRPAG